MGKIKQYKYIILTIILIAGFITGFFIWNHQKTIERKYQACLEKCEGENGILSKYNIDSPRHKVCIAECKEKYAK